MTSSPGKMKGLRAVSDSRGVIAALAIDQRSALRKLFAKAGGVEPDAIPGETLQQFKETVSRILTPHTSAILLDPEYGLRAARARAENAGLLLAYEQTGYDPAVKGRLPRLLPGYSVRRLVEDGADCIKVLLYYSPFSSSEINAIKHAWVERHRRGMPRCGRSLLPRTRRLPRRDRIRRNRIRQDQAGNRDA